MAVKRISSRRSAQEPPLTLLEAAQGGTHLNSLLVVVACAILALGCWLDPGVTRPFPGWTIVAGGVAAVLGGLSLTTFRTSSRSAVTTDVAWIFLLWAGLSCLQSIDSFRSQQSLSAWIGGVGVFALLSCNLKSANCWRLATVGLTLPASLLCLHALSHPTGARLSGTFSNSDTFSVIPMVGVFLALSAAQKAGQPWQLFCWLQVLLFGVTVAASGSRAALAGIGVGLVGLLAFSALVRQKALLKKVFRTSLLMPVAVLLAAVLTGKAGAIFSRVQDLNNGRDYQGLAMREDVLTYGLRLTTQHPIFGTGPGTFALAYQAVRPPGSELPDYIYVNVAHNDFVETAVEFGWPGFCLLGLIWTLVILRGVRLLRTSTASWEVLCCIGGCTALLAFAMFNFIISVPCVLFWMLATLGMLHGLPTQAAQPKFQKRQVLLAASLITGGLWSIWFGWNQAQANRWLAESDNLNSAMRWEDSRPALEKALSAQPQNPQLLLARAQLQAKLGKFRKSPELVKAATADFERASQLSPRDPKILRATSLFALANSNYPLAEKSLELELKYSPYQRGRLRTLARTQLSQDKLRAAASTLYGAWQDDDEYLPALVGVLLDLETRQAGEGVSLVGEWAHQEGHQPRALQVARAVSQQALKLHRPQVANRLMELAIKLEPDNLEAAYLLSLVKAETDEPKEQRKILNGILAKTPNKQEAVTYDKALLDWVRLETDQEAGMRRLENRLKDSPGSVEIRLKICDHLLAKRKPDQAAEFISRGLDVAPEEARLLARMGTCLQAQGLTELAQGYFDRALKSDPGNKEARRALQRKSS